MAGRWTELGETDPLWAALTDRGRGGRWESADFLATGRAEIADVLALLDRRGLTPTLGTALDFGCGPGRLSAALAHAGFARVLGVDVSPTMLATARTLVDDARCEFLHNPGPNLEAVATGTVDLVYSCRVLQHMPAELAHGYVREFLRVVTPGGLVVFQLPAEPASGPAGRAVALLPAPVLNRLRRGMQMHATPAAAVTRLVAECGGVTVSIEEDASAGPRWRSHLYVVHGKA